MEWLCLASIQIQNDTETWGWRGRFGPVLNLLRRGLAAAVHDSVTVDVVRVPVDREVATHLRENYRRDTGRFAGKSRYCRALVIGGDARLGTGEKTGWRLLTDRK